MPPSGEPRESPKPQPIGNAPFISFFTLCTLCALFLIWRRANSLRTVVAHQLRTWTRDEGAIRLSTDDGPPARSFVEDDEEGDEDDAEPLAARIERLRNEREARATPPAPPPKDQAVPVAAPSSTSPAGDPLLS